MSIYFKDANITGLTFEPWSAQNIRDFSVVEVNNVKLYDNQTPAENGLRDPKMGITSRKGVCATCHQTWKACPGHFGHMELATPMYHAGWVHLLSKALKRHCLKCFHVLEKNQSQRKDKKCDMCGEPLSLIQKHDIWYIQIDGKPLLPCDAIDYMNKMPKHDCQHAILNVLPIPPNCVRPSPTIGGDEIRGEDDLTRTLLRIVRMNTTVKKHLGIVKHPKQIKNVLKKLQEVITGYIYRSRSSKGKSKMNTKVTCIGDRIRHKHGRIRGNAMGKRVNFTARAVVGPDAKMGMHQVGIPKYVADTLTITETIHQFNIKKWQDIITNYKKGDECDIKFVVRADGKRLDLRFNQPAIQIGWKVERKLQNGDIALFNRQPSLHKMSIMAHEVLILPGKTFRLNLSCTTPYNADFDGDEMNFHALQTIEARAEAESIMAVKHNIVTPQSHRPVMSLVMDGFLGTSEISHIDTFLNKTEIFDWAMETEKFYEIPIPAICHPKPVWTGKQALSMIMPKELMFKKPRAVVNEALNDVCIHKGQVLYGHFGKKTLGRSQGSLIHVIWLDFGPDACLKFLNNLQRGVHRWFSEQGFSIGVSDFIASQATQDKIEEEYQLTLKEASKLTKESEINQRLNRARDGMGRAAADTLDRNNFLFRMVNCGVKGSMLNILQIMAMVGQQNSSGKRIQPSIAGKTLPCFKADDKSPESLGMVRSPYLKGMEPYEFFFSAIVGRDGLINTAINTAVTGYIQRRLVKAMETCKTEWDGSVRDANGAIIQFKYGEDGFDGQYLEFNSTELKEFSNKQIKDKYDWGDTEEMKEVFEARDAILMANVNQISTCFNVRRQIDRLFRDPPPQCMPHEVRPIIKPYLDWFKQRNKLCWAVVLQTCASKRLAIEFRLTVEEIATVMENFKQKYLKTMIAAGEMVGTLAAQSLGEPVTQMTLDTFHHAGNSAKNVTLGVPRFEELINGSDSPKTPTCSIIFKNKTAAEIDKAIEISFKITYLIVRSVVSDTSIEHINFAQEHPNYFLLPDMPLKKLVKNQKNWCVKLIIPFEKLVHNQIEFVEVLNVLQKKFSKGVNMAYTYNPIGDSIVHIGNYGKKNNKAACAQLRNRIMNLYVRGVPNIKYAQPCLEEGVLSVETIGSNIYELQSLTNDYTCIKTVKSNHPFDVLHTFGIEAARRTLYEQVHAVMSFGGSYVSCRHYQVMINRMTWSGDITPTTRHGIAKYDNKSPLARATFEQPVEVVLNAASHRKTDPLSGVSEQILMGIQPQIGTSMISVHKTEEYKEIEKQQIEEESEDEDDSWCQFDNTSDANLFGAVQKKPQPPPPPMLKPAMPFGGGMPMWAQTQHNVQQPPVQAWNNDVMAAVGNTPFIGGASNDFFAAPQQSFAPPSFSFQPPTNMFQPPAMNFGAPNKPPSPAWRPTSPTYNPNKPPSPAWRPTSPTYNPDGPDEYDPNRPVSPAYDPNRPNGGDSPIGNVGYDGDAYDPMAD